MSSVTGADGYRIEGAITFLMRLGPDTLRHPARSELGPRPGSMLEKLPDHIEEDGGNCTDSNDRKSLDSQQRELVP